MNFVGGTGNEMIVFNNSSWPPGKWGVIYVPEIDKHRITTEYGDFIADVGPTLVATWLVRFYNVLYIGE